MSDMDHIDAKQQIQIDSLAEHAKENARTDFGQWAAISLCLLATAGLAVYFSLFLMAMNRDQAGTIRFMQERCGKGNYPAVYGHGEAR